MLKVFCTALTFGALSCFSAAFAAPSVVRTFSDWVVFSQKSGSDRLCYAATKATDKAPQAVEHGDVWFVVSNWKSRKGWSQPSLKLDFEVRPDRPAKAQIGSKSWRMWGVGSDAFTSDTDDASLVRGIERGRELRVQATSQRNTLVTYHFSLSGSSSAIDKAEAICR